jgi:hypothetical protein
MALTSFALNAAVNRAVTDGCTDSTTILCVTPALGDICAQHLACMKWADGLLLAAVQANMPSRLEILEHIFMAERIWLARIEGKIDQRHFQPPTGAEALAEEWSELHRQWLEWAAGQSDWGQVIAYKTLAGVESSSPLWQIVLHVAKLLDMAVQMSDGLAASQMPARPSAPSLI